MGPHENLVQLITDILVKVKVLLLKFLDLILVLFTCFLFKFLPFKDDNTILIKFYNKL